MTYFDRPRALPAPLDVSPDARIPADSGGVSAEGATPRQILIAAGGALQADLDALALSGGAFFPSAEDGFAAGSVPVGGAFLAPDGDGILSLWRKDSSSTGENLGPAMPLPINLEQIAALTSVANLTSLAALSASANQMPYFTGAGVMAATGLTSEARDLLASTLLSRSGNNLVTSEAARLTGGAVTQSDTDTTSGRLMKVGDFGIGAGGVSGILVGDVDAHRISGLYRFSNSSVGSPPESAGSFLHIGRVGTDSAAQIAVNHSGGRLYVRSLYNDTWTPWHAVLSTGTTTVDSNGFIKSASPIVRLFADRIEEPVEPVGAAMTRHGTGSYSLSGVPPLASDGWQIEVPKDHNGNRLVFVEVSHSGETLTVTTTCPAWDGAQGVWVAGDPLDIPEGRWVDLRFHKEPEPEPEDE